MPEFDFNNDGTYEVGPQPGNTAAYAYPDNGSYTVGVRVSDGDAGTATASTAVTVNNVAPTISLTGAATVDEGTSYSLTLGTVVDPGTDTVSAFAVRWGDGNSDTYSGSPNGLTKTHTYADGPANWTITVDLTDEDGTYSARGSLAVHVDNVAPTANAGGPYTADRGFSIPLSGSATDPAGVNDPLTYDWDLDVDGVFGETGAAAACGAENVQNPTFYAADAPGTIVSTGDTTALYTAPASAEDPQWAQITARLGGASSATGDADVTIEGKLYYSVTINGPYSYYTDLPATVSQDLTWNDAWALFDPDQNDEAVKHAVSGTVTWEGGSATWFDPAHFWFYDTHDSPRRFAWVGKIGVSDAEGVPAMYYQATVEEFKYEIVGADVGGKPNKALAGEPLSLLARVLGTDKDFHDPRTHFTYTWHVPTDDVIKMFDIGVHAEHGHIVPITVFNQETMDLEFVKGGNGKVVTVDLGGEIFGLPELPTKTITIRFNVIRPDATFTVDMESLEEPGHDVAGAHVGKGWLGMNFTDDEDYPFPLAEFGYAWGKTVRPGLTADPLDSEDSWGEFKFAWVQLVTAGSDSTPRRSRTMNPCFDKNIEPGSPSFPTGEEKVYGDSPSMPLGIQFGEECDPFPGWYRYSASLHLWLMAKPSLTDDTHYVPIADFEWNFYFDVLADYNQTIPNKWYYSIVGYHSPGGASHNTTTFPQWDRDSPW